MTTTPPIRVGQGLAYGLLGLPLAFVALPLYVLLPNHYAREFGMPLATLGSVLLAARLFDAVSDPLLGRLSDYLFGRSVRAVLAVGAVFKMAGRVVGEVPDAEFSRLFFGIWLSPQTSEPGLRQELLAATRTAGQP